MSEQIGEAKYKDSKNKNLKIEKIIYEPKEQKLFVNENLHFCGVSEAVWEYKIGGYQVLDKYLKSHKGEEIDYKYFEKSFKAYIKAWKYKHKSLKSHY